MAISHRARGPRAVVGLFLARIRFRNCVLAQMADTCSARQMRNGLLFANLLAWMLITLTVHCVA